MDIPRTGRLLIGFGNSLRQDDGAGRAVAERLGGLSVHQLAPELAETISLAEEVVFIDASSRLEAGEIRISPVQPEIPGAIAHHLSPAQVLGIAGALYGHAPRATLICIGGSQFELGEEFSPPVAAAVEEVCRRLADSGKVWGCDLREG